MSADRKAVISQGLLKCIGSSLYLKLKCGVGYHLRQGDFVSHLHCKNLITALIQLLELCMSRRMSVTENCDAEKISSLVKFHVPNVKLRQQLEAELTFMLPFENMSMLPGETFFSLDAKDVDWKTGIWLGSIGRRCISSTPSRRCSCSFALHTGLFAELDNQKHLGIINYGVSMTTLEDVFLRLEAESEVDQAGQCCLLIGTWNTHKFTKATKCCCYCCSVFDLLCLLSWQCVAFGSHGHSWEIMFGTLHLHAGLRKASFWVVVIFVDHFHIGIIHEICLTV